jgi:hypothetical protein
MNRQDDWDVYYERGQKPQESMNRQEKQMQIERQVAFLAMRSVDTHVPACRAFPGAPLSVLTASHSCLLTGLACRLGLSGSQILPQGRLFKFNTPANQHHRGDCALVFVRFYDAFEVAPAKTVEDSNCESLLRTTATTDRRGPPAFPKRYNGWCQQALRACQCQPDASRSGILTSMTAIPSTAHRLPVGPPHAFVV